MALFGTAPLCGGFIPAISGQWSCGYLWMFVDCLLLGFGFTHCHTIFDLSFQPQIPDASMVYLRYSQWPEFYLRYLSEKGTLPWDSGRLYRFKRWAQLKAICCMNKRHVLFGICLLFATSKLFINTNLHSVKHNVFFNTSLNYPKLPVSI